MATAPVSAGGERPLIPDQPHSGDATYKLPLSKASAWSGVPPCDDIIKFGESQFGSSVIVEFNGATNTITIQPRPGSDPVMHEHAVESPAREATTAKKAAKSKNNIPRPPNAFIIYRKEWHLKTVATNPSLHNNEISKIIGKKWKDESEDVKDAYKRKAEAAKRQHLADNPGYHYQPRKPSEKKKRVTKNKLAKLAAKAVVAHDNSSDNNSNNGVDHSTGNYAMTALPHSAVTQLERVSPQNMAFFTGDDEFGQLAADLTNFNAAHPNLPYNNGDSMPLTLATSSMYDNVSAAETQYFPLDIPDPDDLPLIGDDFGLDLWTASADSLLATNGAGQGFNLNITPNSTAEVTRQTGLEGEALDFGTFFDFNQFPDAGEFA